MSRLSEVCRRAAGAGRKLLIPYLMGGDPHPDISLRLMHELVRQGADVIELGFPFSDPSSDGPVIQRAAERALTGGTGLGDCLDLAARFRAEDDRTPLVLMGYLNPVEVFGYGAFAARCEAAGVDGVLVVDLPPTPASAPALTPALTPASDKERPAQLQEELRRRGVDSIYLVAPTTSEARMALIAGECSGYLYYVSLKGVTGAGPGEGMAAGAAAAETEAGEAVAQTEEQRRTAIAAGVGRLRRLSSLPIVIGFGVKGPESAAAMAALADGVVIGSALVEEIAALAALADKKGSPDAVKDSQIRRAAAIIGRSREALDSLKPPP